MLKSNFRIVLAFVSFFSMSSAFSADVFLVEPMICVGKISAKPADMHPSYTQVGLRFLSFKSTKKDRTLVDSLEVQTQYAGPNGKISTKTEDFGSEIWIMGPLYKKDDQVFRKSLSGRDDNLNLKITKKGANNNYELKGTWTLAGTVVGNYRYNLSCTAKVVDKPSRIDDNTNDGE